MIKKQYEMEKLNKLLTVTCMAAFVMISALSHAQEQYVIKEHIHFKDDILIHVAEDPCKPSIEENTTTSSAFYFNRPIKTPAFIPPHYGKNIEFRIDNFSFCGAKPGNIEFKVDNRTALSIRGEDGRIYIPSSSLVFGKSWGEGFNRIAIIQYGPHGYIDYKDNLHFRADKNWISALTLYGDGNVGVGFGTTYKEGEYLTDGYKLAVNGSIKSNGEVLANNLNVNHYAAIDWSYAARIVVNRDLTKAFVVTKNNTDMFAIYGNGIVAAKKIYAEEFEITPNAMNIHWYDHVFDKDYKLRSLSDLELFIKENRHLPEIPSEKEVKENGINLGKMQGKILLKIEELTLYTIEQQKLIEELQKQVNELQEIIRKGDE
jgi:hypothetical protein